MELEQKTFICMTISWFCVIGSQAYSSSESYPFETFVGEAE